MHKVTLITAGYGKEETYELGELESHDIRSVRVSPKHPSSFKIRYKDHSGAEHLLDVGGYIVPGMSGKINIAIDNDIVVSFQDDSRL